MVTRQETERNLRGRNSANPLEFSSDFNLSPSARLSVGGASSARQVQGQVDDTFGRVLSGLAEFGSKKIREAASQRYAKQAMEGAMAYQQGVAMDDLGGFDKRWQLEGYRQMDASTSAAALLAAQKTEIAQGLYETNPEEYRRIYAERLELATKDKDPRVVELISQQMMEQMPTLVAQHTAEHMGFLERQATSSLETSIDVMSRDPAGTQQLLAFARGEQGSEGLSSEARRNAVINGVARAYDNNNPAAYAILEQQGVLGEMSSAELGTIRAAQARFEQRRRSEYDEEFFLAEQGVIERIRSGEFLDPTDAINEMSQLYTDRGITLTAGEAAGVYDQADRNNEIHHRATTIELDTAKSQGDYGKMAELTGPYIVHIESGGDRNAVSHSGAKSEWQVMDRTNADPGFGVRPAQNDSLAERARVGRDYWNAMVHRYKGDLEAAAVAYNAGPGNADKWLAAGRNFDTAEFTTEAARKEARGYVNKFNKQIGGTVYAARAENRYAEATRQAEIVRESNAVDLYARITPQLAELDDMRIAGAIDDDTWRSTRAGIRGAYGVEQSIANVNQEISVHRSALEAEVARANEAAKNAKTDQDKADTEAYKLNLDLFQSGDIQLQDGLESAIRNIIDREDYDENGNMLSEAERLRLQIEDIEQATTEYLSAQQMIAQDLGINITDMGIPQTTRYIRDTTKAAMDDALDNAEQLADIRHAAERGTLNTLDQGAKDRAWSEFQNGIVNKYANMPPPTSPEAGAARTQDFEREFQDWFVRTGYVPDEIREQASAALTTQLVNKDGEPSEYAIEAAQEYIALKGKSQHAANQYLNPEARVVAEAILSVTGGRTNTIPQTIQRINAASGYSSTGAREADPNFLGRSEVQQAIKVNVSRGKTRGFFASIIGGRGAGLATTTGASRDAEAAISTAIEQRVAAIHAINPNIPPQHVVDMATDSVQQQMAVVRGNLIVDPTGRDIYHDVFGNEANNFRQDPTAINTAINSYLSSEAFANYVPQLGLFDEIMGRTVAGMLTQSGRDAATSPQIAGVQGRTAFDVEAIGNGRLIVNFYINPNESPITVPINLQDVGEHWKSKEKARRTR